MCPMVESTLAETVLDRLLQSAHRHELKGESLRRHRNSNETAKVSLVTQIDGSLVNICEGQTAA